MIISVFVTRINCIVAAVFGAFYVCNNILDLVST